jgi:hypothetical protein
MYLHAGAEYKSSYVSVIIPSFLPSLLLLPLLLSLPSSHYSHFSSFYSSPSSSHSSTGQSNSEHSRHWFFGGKMIIDGEEKKETLFSMVKSTLPEKSNSVIAFHDNSSVSTYQFAVCLFVRLVVRL